MRSTRAVRVGFLLLLLGGVAFYWTFRSPNLLAVDGGFRSLEVYHRQEVFFHQYSHLFYPVVVLGWDRLMQRALGPPADGLTFARRTQLMNGLAMAAAVGLLFLLVHGATDSVGAAVGAALAYGFARAVVLHATNAAEPPVGLALSMLAVAAAAGARDGTGRRAWLAAVAGVSLAAAMAVYQTMILIGPAVLLLCVAPTTSVPADRGRWGQRGQAQRLVLFLAGSAVGVVALYGWVLAHVGITGVLEKLRFITADGSVYGGLSLSKVINAPVGLVGNLFHAYPADYAGLRALFRDHLTDGWVAWLVFLLLANAALAVVLGGLVWRHRGMLGPTQRLAFVVTMVALVCTLVGPFYWQPVYDKMWLQPLAAIIVLVALALSALPSSRSRKFLVAAAFGLLALEMSSSWHWVIAHSGPETPYLQEARRVNEQLRPEDLLIYDWDPVSTLYSSLYGHGRPQLCVPTVALARGAAVIDDIRGMIKQAEARRGRVYFLGILDQSEEVWRRFLGDRLGVPYHLLDEYRFHSRPVATFQVDGKSVSLRLHEVEVRR